MRESHKETDTQPTKIYKFGNCYLNKIERKVFKDGEHLEIASRAFDILQLLIEKQGEIVSKEEILNEVWNDSFVEEGNLTVYVSKLRKLLDANKSDSFIETVSGVGYRFVSRAISISENEWEKLTLNNGNAIKVTNFTSPKTDSIAVLPLKNKNGDEEIDYLADGITESIINNLSYNPNLRVLARNSVFQYKDKAVNIQEVGKTLGATHILAGRIRVIRDNLIIGVELTRVEDNSQLWGTQLNQPFENVFEVQEKITKTISETLRTQIGDEIENLSTRQITQNPESYRYYLKAKYLLNKKSIKDIPIMVEFFQQSISIDPQNAHSYIELANCHRFSYAVDQVNHKETLNKILPLLRKANEINPQVYELYALKGWIKMFLQFDLTGAESDFKQAFSLNPTSLITRGYYSKLLTYTSRFSEAINQINEMAKLDPISVLNNRRIAQIFFCMEQYDNAITKLNECLVLESNDFPTLLFKGFCLLELGKYDEALSYFQKSVKIQDNLETNFMICYALAQNGNIDKMKKTLKEIEKKSSNKLIPNYYYGFIFAVSGKIDEAFECLEKAYDDKYSDLIGLKIDPRFKPIRHDPRFNKMLLKIGLPVD